LTIAVESLRRQPRLPGDTSPYVYRQRHLVPRHPVPECCSPLCTPPPAAPASAAAPHTAPPPPSLHVACNLTSPRRATLPRGHRRALSPAQPGRVGCKAAWADATARPRRCTQWSDHICISMISILSRFKISKRRIKSYENICTCKNVESLHVYSFAVQKPTYKIVHHCLLYQIAVIN
jgi:hypothetical protein